MCPIRLAIPEAHVPSRVQSLDLAAMGAETSEDADLLRAHVAGDPHAFERLYDRYDRRCFLYIRRLLGQARGDAAEDLHQETWISISRNAGGFDPTRASFRAWMYTAARNKVWDHFRRQKVAILTSVQDSAAIMVADPAPTPLEAVESRELALKIVAAVEALPLAQRETFVMFAQAGLSLEEISNITGAGVETIKSRLRYARTALRQALTTERSAHA